MSKAREVKFLIMELLGSLSIEELIVNQEFVKKSRAFVQLLEGRICHETH